MLKQRLLTALILIPLIVWVFTLSSQTVAQVISFITLLGAWEWAGLCGFHTRAKRAIYTIFIGIALFAIYWFWHQPSMVFLLTAACLWWLVASLMILRYQQGFLDTTVPKSPFIKALLGFFILLPAWIAIVHLHGRNDGGQWVLFLLILIWAADSGAYFVGKRWGRIKLADKISPGKTWEGVMGALLIGSLVSLCYAVFKSMSLTIFLLFMLLCLLTVIVSIVGDLLESLFKRQMGIKDSGQILPGHGGVLDRIDSLTAAAPFFVMGLILLGLLF
ncbi:phosphatidate cytidylyltransferase [Candidatus Parabeggiatoa sp. HSG14]|uniref:phosphatidate cytidylyltransferase n=1 Tax=Candidatus Parabeggiatoa sp. HSG14 TaxID=3055593 RepID=UPI0025A7D54C|nr:CDP-archaeol synthase [Thiotrichales bacterium HSG14]